MNGIGDCEVVYDFDLATSGDQSHVHADLAADLFCSGHVNIAPESQSDLIYPITLTVGGQDSDGGGGNGTDTLWLPDGVTQGDLQTLGVTIQNVESVSLTAPQDWGQSECL
jgi:hypothetical protein